VKLDLLEIAKVIERNRVRLIIGDGPFVER
jgi:hypothetical protein